MEAFLPIANILGGVGSSLGTAFGGWQAQQQNQQRFDQANQYLNDFWRVPSQHLQAGQTLADIPEQFRGAYQGGAPYQYTEALRRGLAQYAPGGSLDAGRFGDFIQTQGAQLADSGMQWLKGQGTQQRKDLNQRFDNTRAEMQANLSDRGLSATTVVPTMNAGVERERSDAMGALDERLNMQHLNASQQLGANRINSFLQGYDIRQGGLQNELGLNQQLYGVDQDRLFSFLNLITGVQNPYPSQANNIALNQASGMAAAPAPNYPRASSSDAFWQSFAPSIISGGTAAAILS